MARGCGVGVRSVSVVPDEHSDGRVVGYGPGGGLNCRTRTDCLMTLWSGPLAEERAVGLWQGRLGLPDHLERGQLRAFQHLRKDEHLYTDMQALLDISEDPGGSGPGRARRGVTTSGAGYSTCWSTLPCGLRWRRSPALSGSTGS
jgi:hypothetical protein